MAKRNQKTSLNPEITIVIGTLNRPRVVIPLINQLIKESRKYPLEVVVIDQSLPKNYKDLLDKFPKKKSFKLFHFDKPNTIKYLNFGWRKAKAPIVLFIDDDVSITENTLKSHIQAYSSLSVKGVAGRVINDKEVVTKNSEVGRVKWFGATITKNYSYEKKVFVDFPYGCNMSFRKEILKEFNGFDKRLSSPIYGYNEVDLGYRITKKYPKSIIFLPLALVYHHRYTKGGTRNNFSSKNIFHSNQFNYGYFLGKNFSLFENIICLLRRFLYQLMKEPKAISHIYQGFVYAKKTK